MGWQAHSKREHPSGGSAEPEEVSLESFEDAPKKEACIPHLCRPRLLSIACQAEAQRGSLGKGVGML